MLQIQAAGTLPQANKEAQTVLRKEDDGGVKIGTATGVYMQYRDYYRDPLPQCQAPVSCLGGSGACWDEPIALWRRQHSAR